nr:hypothetical protein [Streptomyces sp. ODS25]
MPDYTALLEELRKVRRAGLVRLRQLELPALTSVGTACRTGHAAAPRGIGWGIEQALRTAVARLGGGTLQEAAEFALGLAQGTRDWPASDRRRRAAQVYGVSPERFRKHHEPMVLGQIADQLVQLTAAEATGHAPLIASSPARLAPSHRHLRMRVSGRAVIVTVHVHSVDLLRDIDVVVAPTNTYFALPAPYKSSVSAALRRAGARRDPAGGIAEDHLQAELTQWVARHGGPGRPADAGTVAVTTAGALGHQGIRRIYHAAVAVPRPGTNEYEVQPADVTRAMARVFALLSHESGRHDPPLRSLCLPLLGAGRGGLEPAASFTAVWAAVEAEWARGAEWEVHFVVRNPDRADLLQRMLGELGAVR